MPNDNQTGEKRKCSDLFSAFRVKQDYKNRVKILNICISLDLIFSFSIFGYVSIKPIALTTVHIPVIMAAMLAGPSGGAATGLVFGLTSMWKASVSGVAYSDIIFSPFRSGMPVQSLALSLGTRILFGWAAGMMFKLLFTKADKKWYSTGAMVISVVATMLHSFLVSLAMRVFFKDSDVSLSGSILPNLRHVSVWAVTAIFVYLVYRLFSKPSFLMQYKKVIQYRRSNKSSSNRMIVWLMLVFLVVSAAIIMHSFDRLSLLDFSRNTTAQTDMTAVSIAIQQLLALSGAIYIIAQIMLFVADRGNIADAKLRQKEQEEIYQKRLQKTLDVMKALSKDYEVVLNMDLEAGTVTKYSCSEKMKDLVSDESLGKPFYEAGEQFYRDLACEEDLPELLALTTREKIEEYLKNDRIFSHVFKNKEGRYGESKIVPINDHEFVCGYTDVDDSFREKLKQQEKLEKAMLAAEAANRAKSAFLLNMSHDIRTPMNAIIGYTDILARYRTDEEQFNRCTANIKASGQYLLDLINNVLEMARIESGVETIDEKPCDVRSILSSAYIVFKEDAERKGISLTYDRNVMHSFLYVDRVKLQQIHLNVLSNALKYTKPGGSVKIMSNELPDEREGWCRIQTVTTDTGIGMSEEFLEHIFDEFSREQDSTTAGTQGTGLGMGIVRKLVDMMGGEIDITSKKGVGTTIKITIPHRIADESQVDVAEQVDINDESLFKGRRILLAEDNELNADIAMELLGDVGLEVELAQDGIICISKLETAPAGYYDLILMDVQMPNMDGYQATEIIRKLSDKKKAEIPIIAMTANAFARDRKAALNAGMNDHVSKPISIAKLVSVMSKYITK